jgi:arylsulfatase A-like enzyme
LRGQKGTLYEGGVRVCAFVNWPGKLKPSKFKAPMHVCDWFPTLAALVEYQPPKDLHWDGVNQWPALTGAAPRDELTRTIYIASHGGEALRHGDWKLIAFRGGKVELFNIAEDPFEQRNLANDQPQKVAQLQRLVAQQRALDVSELPADLVGIRD